jgi:hypothetical protein
LTPPYPADGPQAALTLVPLDGTAVVNVDLSTLLDNDPSQLLFRLPEDAPLDTYRLTITTHFAPSGKELKTTHSATFDVVLTVVAPASRVGG